jgi:hypothetical protein
MNEFDHFKVFILYSGDVITDIDHLYIKKIHLVRFSYIVIEDSVFWLAISPTQYHITFKNKNLMKSMKAVGTTN